MTHTIQITSLVLVLFIAFPFGSLFSQNSQRFNFDGDTFVAYDPSSNEIFKASFLKEKIDSLIEFNPDIIKVGILKFSNMEYFTLYGVKDNSSSVYNIICDYPCPQYCVPPEETKRDSISPNEFILKHKFDKSDIDTVLQRYTDIKYINIRRAKHYDNSTLAIYAVTHKILVGLREQKDENDVIFISVNDLQQ